jgi:glycosyltransferase involved in cell wall biosynthesis
MTLPEAARINARRKNSHPITIFTPSDAAADNSNAQNLTVKEIVARLPEDQFRVTMLCGGEPDPRLLRRTNTRMVKWTNHGNTLRLLRHCLFPPPDIYFFPHSGPLDRVFFDIRKRMGLRTALVTYIVLDMNRVTGGGLIGRSILEADVVFANSRYVADTILQNFNVEAKPIYDGIDRRHYFAAGRPENVAPVVLYAGSFQARKRVEVLIEQAARFPALQFRLAGKGETERNCRELVQRLDCRNVVFLGHLSSQALGQEMRQADIFLFPSLLEGNPQVLLQAAACGLPSIAMELYRPDSLVDGKTGILACSDEELSRGLERLAGDAALRRSFSEAAICHARKFDWDDIAQQWAGAFQEVVARRRLAVTSQIDRRAS